MDNTRVGNNSRQYEGISLNNNFVLIFGVENYYFEIAINVRNEAKLQSAAI